MAQKIYYIEGDGIGPEIWRATMPVLNAALSLESAEPLEWVEVYVGEKALRDKGSLLPEETLATMKTATVAMKGPLSTPIGYGFRSLNVALRQVLDLYACIRPVRYFPGLKTPVTHPERVDMVIFRENTEDVHVGIEFEAHSPEARKLVEYLWEELGARKLDKDTAISIKAMTEKNSKRLVRKAIQYALENDRGSVTLIHKGNVMKFTEGAFRKWGYEVAKEEFGDRTCTEKETAPGKVIIKDRVADAMFQEILLRPETYSVIAAPNLNGDYLSDALAAQVGGLGLAPGVNMSDSIALFEPTHGTAPGSVGKDRANPGALILSGAMMLEHLGEKKAASRVRTAVGKAILGKRVTWDLARQLPGSTVVGCQEFGEIIGSNL